MKSECALTAEGWVLVRRPLLSLTEYERLLQIPTLEELACDLLTRPEVRALVSVASPSLSREFLNRHEYPKRADTRARAALWRYAVRAMTRCTPFGLCAGVAIADMTTTDMSDGDAVHWRVLVRLDMEALARICARVNRATPAAARRFECNSTLWDTGSSARFLERVEGADGRVGYRICEVKLSAVVRRVLALARSGFTGQEALRALIGVGATEEQAEVLLRELVERQVLVEGLRPSITGGDAWSDVVAAVEALADRDPELHEQVRCVANALAICNQSPVGTIEEPLRALDGALRVLATGTKEDVAVTHVDLFAERSGVSVNAEEVHEVAEAVELLTRFGEVTVRQARSEVELTTFRETFQARFGSQRVPLLRALDPDWGVAFAGTWGTGEDAPPPIEETNARAVLPDWFLSRLLGTPTGGSVVLEASDFSSRSLGSPLPDGLVANARPIESGSESGGAHWLLLGAFGPSSIAHLGRFGCSVPGLDERLRALAAAEAQGRPNATMAELVHVPDWRAGNIIARPHYREKEIPFAARSGMPLERQMFLDELVVGIERDRLVLRERQSGREVIPRMASAHAALGGVQLPLYRFLVALQYQGTSCNLSWSWGPLANVRRLPRVTVGRVVVAVAKWTFDAGELKPLRGLNGDTERLRWIQQWREAQGIPERFVFAQADHELLVDSRHAPSILSWLYAVPRRGNVAVCEWLRPRAGASETIATELMIPLRVSESVRRQDRPVDDESVTRVGTDSGWLFGKLYCAQGMADRLLHEVAGPTARALEEAGMARAWFYVRYGDPHYHIRLRLRLAERAPTGTALALFSRLLNEAFVRCDVDDFAIVTYEREVGRYGGERGIEVAEEIFCAESGHLVRVCAAAPDGVGQSARFWCVFQSIHDLLEALVPDLAARIEALRPLRHHFVTEQFPATDGDARRSLAKMLRHNQTRIAAILARGAVEGMPGIARQAIEERREALAGRADMYRHLEARGELTRPLHQIAGALCHMTANRLFARQPRRREAMVYDLLLQTLRSQAARERVGG